MGVLPCAPGGVKCVRGHVGARLRLCACVLSCVRAHAALGFGGEIRSSAGGQGFAVFLSDSERDYSGRLVELAMYIKGIDD